MKLGFVLSNYKAKLQIEVRSLKKKLGNGILDKLFRNSRNEKIIKQKEIIIHFIDSYIKNLEVNNPNKLDRNVDFKLNGKNINELKEILDNI